MLPCTTTLVYQIVHHMIAPEKAISDSLAAMD